MSYVKPQFGMENLEKNNKNQAGEGNLELK